MYWQKLQNVGILLSTLVSSFKKPSKLFQHHDFSMKTVLYCPRFDKAFDIEECMQAKEGEYVIHDD